MEIAMQTGLSKKKKRRRIILLSILGLLIILRILLPYLVLNYVNKKLAGLTEYYGHVRDIDIHLYRGAYVIKDMELIKRDEEKGTLDTIRFFVCPGIDLSIEWRAVFKGAIVGEVHMNEPVLNFVKGKHKDEDVKQDTADFNQLVSDLMPLTINHVEISNGQVHYIDLTKNPHLDIFMKSVNAEVTNITNVNDSTKLLPASLQAEAKAYEGELSLKVNFDGLKDVPTFDLNATFLNINLALLNDFLGAYGNFDVKKGNFSLYTEFAAKEGNFGGYVKPIIRDLDVVQWNKEEGNVGQILWETLVGSAAEVFQNQRTEVLGTKLPINGKFDNPETNIWKAISYVLRNAFVHALKPSIDSSINIYKLEESDKKTVLEKIFNSRKKKKSNEKK